MISVQSHLPQPIQVPKCFVDWVKEREVLFPQFMFVIALGENDDEGLTGWRMKNNVVVYNAGGMGYSVRILTGRPMHKRDLNPAVGFDRDTLRTAAPFVYILPLPEQPSELVPFEARSYDVLAELDKSYEMSKHKDEGNHIGGEVSN